MQRTTAGLVLLGLVLASLLVLGATSALSAQQPESETANGSATISVTGSGEVTAEPDRATVRVGVVGTGATAGEAADEVAANATRLRSALNDSDAVLEVRSTDYRVREERQAPPRPEPSLPGGEADAGQPDEGAADTGQPDEGQPDEGQPDAEADGARDDPATERAGSQRFVAEQTFAIELAETDVAGDAVDLAVRNGASEVQGVSFTLSEERHDELRREAIDEAVADADDQAAAIAESAGLERGEVRRISTADRGFVPVAQDDAAATAGTEIDPNDVTVRASVEVTYDATGQREVI